jgi:hypothetical protein
LEAGVEFVLPTLKFLIYIGIGCIVLGILLVLGILKGNAGILGNFLGGLFVIALGIFLITLKSPGTIVVDQEQMVLKVPLYKAKVINAQEVEKAWIEDLENSEWRPMRKTSGTSAGKFRSGWFKLKNGRKAFLILYGMKAICIEMEGGELYLIGIKDFDRLADALRATIPQLSMVPTYPQRSP